MQNLILPINDTKLTASMKTPAYLKKYGFQHYGIDMVSAKGSQLLYASGDGLVLYVGVDNIVGNVLLIRYPDAVNHQQSITRDVVFRYFHLQTIYVKPGEQVTRDSRIALLGNTGILKMPLHLHLEADTDTAHALFSPTVKSSSFLKGSALGATDSSMSPAVEWLFCKRSAPDNQSYRTANDAFINTQDKTIPFLD